MKYIVIGGVAGGASFATRMRRLNEQIDIVMLERGENISFASCALPYYIGGVIPDRNALIERTPETLKVKNNIDVRTKHEVVAIDPQKKLLTVHDLFTDNTYEEHYDKLILATGARPTLPPIEGANEAPNGFVLRNVTDGDKIVHYLETHDPKTVTILGAGAAGLELAENLVHRGLTVTLIDQLPQVAFPYDEEMAALIQAELEKHGVKLHLGHTVSKISADGQTLTLDDGATLTTEMIIFATGVRPNNEIAAAAGIQLSDNGLIVVDDRLQTNLPDVYAIGDVIETTSFITGLATPSMLSSAANRQGHLLADILAGADFHYKGYIGAGVARIFDLTAAYAGLTEHALQKIGKTDYKTVLITPFSHAYFFPGATRVNFKLIFEDKTGKILGGQAVGEKGIDKRISELSVAISGGLTVYDLPDLEMPYSPPYSATRDVLNTAGYVAINQLTNVVTTIKAADIPAEDLENAYFLDIREPGKAPAGSIKATANIPMNELRRRISEIPKDKKVYITFRKGLNPYNSARILAGFGIKAILIEEDQG